MGKSKVEKTGSFCPVCGGDIVCATRLVDNLPALSLVDGPDSESNFREEKSFRCAVCGVSVAFPTPKNVSTVMRRKDIEEYHPRGEVFWDLTMMIGD
jgi:hypothetical protein